MDPLTTDYERRDYAHSERRKSYPELFQTLGKMQEKMERIDQRLETLQGALTGHISETEELTNAWLHSRWLVSTLKALAVIAASVAAGWLAIQQLFHRG